MANPVQWWRERSARKQAAVEARHMIKEARRILRKKSYRIPESVARVVSGAVDEVDSALGDSDFERLRRAISVLDDKMDEHLAFARKSTLREYSESIGVAVAVALLLRAFVVEAFQIPSSSMVPTLEVGDHIFVSKFAYGIGIPFTNTKLLELRSPARGDVIVFKYPVDPSIDYIKRVVGLPGDEIEVRRNEVFVNGRAVPREKDDKPCRYFDVQQGSGVRDDHDCELWAETLDGKRHATIHEPSRNGGFGGSHDSGRYKVPLGSVFVMGDNRDNSSDSRVWGPVSHELIKGKALIVWWSRGNADGLWGLSKGWWQSIRWTRFFHTND